MKRLANTFILWAIGWAPFLVLSAVVGTGREVGVALAACAVSVIWALVIDKVMWRANEFFYAGKDRAGGPWALTTRALSLLATALFIAWIAAFPLLAQLSATWHWIFYSCAALWLLILPAVLNYAAFVHVGAESACKDNRHCLIVVDSRMQSTTGSWVSGRICERPKCDYGAFSMTTDHRGTTVEQLSTKQEVLAWARPGPRD